jgi:hypothetical protein
MGRTDWFIVIFLNGAIIVCGLIGSADIYIGQMTRPAVTTPLVTSGAIEDKERIFTDLFTCRF